MDSYKYLLIDWILNRISPQRLLSTDVVKFDRWMSYDDLLSSGYVKFIYNGKYYVIESDVLFLHVFIHCTGSIVNNMYRITIFTDVFDEYRAENLYMITTDFREKADLYDML